MRRLRGERVRRPARPSGRGCSTTSWRRPRAARRRRPRSRRDDAAARPQRHRAEAAKSQKVKGEGDGGAAEERAHGGDPEALAARMTIVHKHDLSFCRRSPSTWTRRPRAGTGTCRPPRTRRRAPAASAPKSGRGREVRSVVLHRSRGCALRRDREERRTAGTRGRSWTSAAAGSAETDPSKGVTSDPWAEDEGEEGRGRRPDCAAVSGQRAPLAGFSKIV